MRRHAGEYRKRLVSFLLCIVVVFAASCAKKDIKLSYEDFVAVKDIEETYSRDIYAALGSSNVQKLVTEYQMSRFERPIEDYTEEELMQEYDTLLKVYDLACKNGYEPERYTKESYRNLLLANLETVDAFVGRDGEANLAYKQNIEAAAKAAGLSFDEYVDEVMIPYIKVWYAKEALQSYYFKKIYFGKFKEMNRTEKELYDKWEETQTSEDMNAWLEFHASEEYQNAYISFMKEFEEYCKTL